MAEADGSPGLGAGLLRAAGTVLGFHVRIAQREAANDLGRIVAGIVLVLLAVIALTFALVGAHVAAVIALAELTPLSWLRAVGVVACVDVLAGIALGTLGRARLKRPVLRETRTLLRDTLASIGGVP